MPAPPRSAQVWVDASTSKNFHPWSACRPEAMHLHELLLCVAPCQGAAQAFCHISRRLFVLGGCLFMQRRHHVGLARHPFRIGSPVLTLIMSSL